MGERTPRPPRHLSRRRLLAAGAAGAAALALGAPRGRAEPRRELKMVTTWPKNFPGLGTSAENLARLIGEMSNGALRVRVFAAGELVGAFEAFDAVSTGVADMYHGAEYYWQGKSPAFNFFTAVPFGMTARELSAWIYEGGGQALWDELSARFRIRAFLATSTGVQMGGWFNREIRQVADLQGLKVRMPGLGGEVLRRLGAAAVALPGSEIFPALSSGAIDASEWVGPWNDQAFGFHQIARYYYWPGFHEPGAGLAAGIRLNVWEELPPWQQQIIRTACAAEVEKSLAAFHHNNARALASLQTEHGVQLRRFPQPVLKELQRVAQEVLEEIAARDPLTKRIYQSFRTNLERMQPWSRIAEEAYLQMRSQLTADG